VEQPGQQGLTTLTRSPATYNGTSDSRARQTADALTNVDRNIPEHPIKANLSRLSCPYLRAIFGRHHPLRHSANEVSRIRSTVKMRQKAATDLSQYDAL
jgi:hypothetical protein